MFEKLLILFYYLKTKYALSFRSRTELERWQARQMKRFLKKIIPQSPFYAKLCKEGISLEKLPIMNKSIMMQNFDALNTAGISLAEALLVAQQAEESRDFTPSVRGYTVGLSSGTSGIRGVFLVSAKERAKWCGTILAKALPDGLFCSAKIAFFLRADSNLYETIKSRFLKFRFFDLKQDFDTHIDDLHSFQPDLVAAPPMALWLLSQAKKQGRLQIFPKKIISVADVLYPDMQAEIEKIFALPVHQIYQATEGFLGITCRYGHLHLNEELVHVEKKYIDKKQGKFVPIITDFNRTTQPMIHYELTDILTEDVAPCPCGNPSVRLKQIEGRQDDLLLFHTTQGKEKIIFPDFIVRAVLKASPNAGVFQVKQMAEKTLCVYADLNAKQQAILRAELEKLLADVVDVHLSFLPAPQGLPLHQKYKRVVALRKSA